MSGIQVNKIQEKILKSVDPKMSIGKIKGLFCEMRKYSIAP